MPCANVEVEAIPDTSTLSIENVTATSSSQEVARVGYSVVNTITSGEGETITRTVFVTLNGNQVAQNDFTVGPGESTNDILDFQDVPPGNVEFCVEF